MKIQSRFAFTGAAVLVAALMAPQLVVAAGEGRTPEQCASLFAQLNTSGTGKLTATEAAGDPTIAKAFSNPQVQQKGYLTRDEFNSVCTGDSQRKSVDQQKPPAGQ